MTHRLLSCSSMLLIMGCSSDRPMQSWPDTHPANENAAQAVPLERSKTLNTADDESVQKSSSSKGTESPKTPEPAPHHHEHEGHTQPGESK